MEAALVLLSVDGAVVVIVVGPVDWVCPDGASIDEGGGAVEVGVLVVVTVVGVDPVDEGSVSATEPGRRTGKGGTGTPAGMGRPATLWPVVPAVPEVTVGGCPELGPVAVGPLFASGLAGGGPIVRVVMVGPPLVLGPVDCGPVEVGAPVADGPVVPAVPALGLVSTGCGRPGGPDGEPLSGALLTVPDGAADGAGPPDDADCPGVQGW